MTARNGFGLMDHLSLTLTGIPENLTTPEDMRDAEKCTLLHFKGNGMMKAAVPVPVTFVKPTVRELFILRLFSFQTFYIGN